MEDLFPPSFSSLTAPCSDVALQLHQLPTGNFMVGWNIHCPAHDLLLICQDVVISMDILLALAINLFFFLKGQLSLKNTLATKEKRITNTK